MERVIAKVERVYLGFEDHGAFGFNIAFASGGWGQGTGWYILASKSEGVSCSFLMRVIQSFGVEDWQRIVGCTVWIERDDLGVRAWENLPTEPGFRFVVKDEIEVAK